MAEFDGQRGSFGSPPVHSAQGLVANSVRMILNVGDSVTDAAFDKEERVARTSASMNGFLLTARARSTEPLSPQEDGREKAHQPRPDRHRRATWLILPVVICLSQRLSHACLSTNSHGVKLQMAH